jgi:spore maturation protein CgeB
MKIVIAGKNGSNIHEKPLNNAFIELGHESSIFSWGIYFQKNNRNILTRLWSKIEYKLNYGIIIGYIANRLIDYIRATKPDVLFVYRGQIIGARTLNKVKKIQPNIILISYNNDDPFSKYYKPYTWYKFRKSIQYYDIVLSYRPSNIEDYKNHKAKHVRLMPPWFVKDNNYNVVLKSDDVVKYKTEVVFVGHYENDGREKILEEIVDAGIELKLYGPEWDEIVLNNAKLKHLYPIEYLYGDEYNKALSGAKIALCIYSTLNRDVYTRRCFEIPATKTFMLAPRTQEMMEFFVDGSEAVYYDDKDDLIKKIKSYLANEDVRKKIANNGFKRCINSKYDVVGRAEVILKTVEDYGSYEAY